jgi:ubiquinone/menaquinone biosynthesis C-methylase UbiE
MFDPNAELKEGLYSNLFARIYDPFMAKMEERVLGHYRKQLLHDLCGNVLEVGCGTGINFPFYPASCTVVACEPSANMLKYAEARLKQQPVAATVHLVLAGVGSAALEPHVPTEGFDAIVCTLVLCTIPEPEIAVELFKRWLKPEGRLIVLEHVHGGTQPRRLIHNLLNPAWKQLAEGCNLTRNTESLLRKHGFEPVWQHDFVKVLPFHVSVMKRTN